MLIRNHGPLIVASDFWGSPHEVAGKLFLSTNAGAVRLLVPRSQEAAIPEMATGKHVVISLGPWPAAGAAEAVELLFDDGTDNPYALHLTLNSVADAVPSPDQQGWVFTAWTAPRRDKPHKALERKCYVRRVKAIPYLKPWAGDSR